jgi:hypothetical protein
MLEPDRREDDRRIEKLDRKIEDLTNAFYKFRDELRSEPDASPLGRSLLGRWAENRARIERLEHQVDLLEKWRDQWQGSWRLVTGAAVVLGLIATFFSVVKPVVDVVAR